MNDKEFKASDSIDRLARELPQKIQPSTDLWPAIEAQLESPSMAGSTGTQSRWLQAAAVAVVLVVASSLATTVFLRGKETQESALAGRISKPMATDPGLQAPDLLAVSGLSDEDRDIVIANLDLVRAARASIEQALQKDPNNTGLHNSWLRVYEQELDLLNDVAWTTNRLAERVKI